MRQDTTTSDSGADQAVELFVTTDGELQVSRGDALDAQILGRVTCELKDFGGEVLQNCRRVDGSFGADTNVVLRTAFQVSVNSTNRELFGQQKANTSASWSRTTSVVRIHPCTRPNSSHIAPSDAVRLSMICLLDALRLTQSEVWIVASYTRHNGRHSSRLQSRGILYVADGWMLVFSRRST